MANFLSNYPNLRDYVVFSGSTEIARIGSGVTFRGNIGGLGPFNGLTGVTFEGVTFLGGTYIAPGTTIGSTLANEELNTLYNYLTGLTGTTYSGYRYLGDGTTGITNTAVTGITLFSPGVHIFPVGYSVIGNLILNGSTGDQYVFVNQNQSIAYTSFGLNTPANVTLTGGITPYDVFWVNMIAPQAPAYYQNNSSVLGIVVSNGDANITNSSLIGGLYTRSKFSCDNSSILSPGLLGIPCYVKGSKLLTPNGYVCVEDLKVGDSLLVFGTIGETVLLEESVEQIKWIGKFSPPLNDKTRPVRFKQSYSPDLTEEDLCVSPGHGMIVDGRLFCARDLISESVVYDDCEKVEYYHIELPKYSVLKANGVLAESYSEGDNRSIFSPVV